jgi:hypothetical protein
MIVVNLEGMVVGYGHSIERVDAQGEENLIKVTVNPDIEYGFYYIGTEDRDEYVIYTDLNIPDETKQWKYIDGQFIDMTPEELI